MEANAYAVASLEAGKQPETVLAALNHLRDYADFLEKEKLDWRHFPLRKKDRCLFRYRGNLIERRQTGDLSPSTASARISAVVRYYRWAKAERLIHSHHLWQDRRTVIRTHTLEGLERTFPVTSSDLAIPNRLRPGSRLEGGLLPLSESSRQTLLDFLLRKGMSELYLMFVLGFFSGARIETIRSFRLSTLDSGHVDPAIPNLLRVPVGPPTLVKSKFNVSGHLLIPSAVIHLLQKYSTSTRRLVRQSRASDDEKTLLFLTCTGRRYRENSFTSLMCKLRQKLSEHGHGEFAQLKFHATRATFGTQLMRWSLQATTNQETAIAFVRDAMLHKDESTTWKYITFLRNEPLKEKLSDEFFDFFAGREALTEEVING